MVFIRPKILRDSVQTAFETNAKYNAIRQVQSQGGGINLMPLEDRPMLPPIESLREGAPIDTSNPPESDE